MRVFLQPGYVLHARPYSESSLVLDAFTPGYGRVGLVAKGARRRSSPLAGLLQPFQPLLLSWSGRQDLVTLVGCEARESVPRLSGRKLFSGLYVNELIMRLVQRQDALSEVYTAYARVLRSLAEDEETEWCLRIFEKQVLQGLGYGLMLVTEAGDGQPVHAGGRYHYHPEYGPTPIGQGALGGVPVTGETLLSLAAESGDTPHIRAEAKRLMRRVLRLYLGDRPLKSRELFRSTGREQRAAVVDAASGSDNP